MYRGLTIRRDGSVDWDGGGASRSVRLRRYTWNTSGYQRVRTDQLTPGCMLNLRPLMADLPLFYGGTRYDGGSYEEYEPGTFGVRGVPPEVRIDTTGFRGKPPPPPPTPAPTPGLGSGTAQKGDDGAEEEYVDTTNYVDIEPYSGMAWRKSRHGTLYLDQQHAFELFDTGMRPVMLP